VNISLAHAIPSRAFAALRHALAAGERFATVAIALDKVVRPINEVGVGARDKVAWEAGNDIVARKSVRKVLVNCILYSWYGLDL
jgi:hypothetical protein